MISPEYHRALELSRRHHRLNKTFSGNLVKRDAITIRQLIDERGCRTALDYGCGKGRQYEWRAPAGLPIPEGMGLEEFWGVQITKFDPAVPEFEVEPEGSFDLVICTNVLRIIPKADVHSVIQNVFAHAERAAFFSEKVGPVTKKPDLRDPQLFPVTWGATDWINAIGFLATVPTMLAILSTTPEGEPDRQIFRLGPK